MRALTAVLLVAVLIAGCLGGEKAGGAAPGDGVEVDYAAFFQDGTLFDTTYETATRNISVRKVPYFNMARPFKPLSFTLGSAPAIPVGLQEAVVGMRIGEEREVDVPPERGYGPRDERLMEVLPRLTAVPLIEVVGPEEFYGSTGSLPIVGESYEYGGLPWNVTVLGSSGENVTIRNDLAEGMWLAFPGTSWNTSVVRVMDGKAVLRVEVRPYAWVLLYPKIGIVRAVDEETFVVDFNHPAAGATLLYKIKLTNMTKGPPS
ncbi:MAG: FKBP-type peptidyl-prolyl cis-trans isomerase [Candidatus Hydrothermarchaeota archaeon]